MNILKDLEVALIMQTDDPLFYDLIGLNPPCFEFLLGPVLCLPKTPESPTGLPFVEGTLLIRDWVFNSNLLFQTVTLLLDYHFSVLLSLSLQTHFLYVSVLLLSSPPLDRDLRDVGRIPQIAKPLRQYADESECTYRIVNMFFYESWKCMSRVPDEASGLKQAPAF